MDSNLEKIWANKLDKLVKFSNENSYEVVFSPKNLKTKSSLAYNEVDFEKKIIKIYSGFCNEYKVYLLLHELGHVMINKDKKAYKKFCGYGQLNFSKNSITNKISVIEEEFEAWKSGQYIAEELKVKINKRKYEKLKATCLSSYARWYFEEKK